MVGCGVGQVVGSHPYCVTVTVLLVTIVCVLTSALLAKFPDFTDPQLGFETRGTEMAQRLTTFDNLVKATGGNGPLEDNPEQIKVQKKVWTKVKVPQNSSDVGHIALSPPNNVDNVVGATDRLAQTLKEEDKPGRIEAEAEDDEEEDASDEDNHQHHNHVSSDGFFCEQLSGAYSHVIVQATPGNSLMSATTLHAQCRLQARLMSAPKTASVCQKVTPENCCPPWSLANYVALLSNRSDCLDITDEDVREVRNLLQHCSDVLSPRSNVSSLCRHREAAYAILYFLTPMDASLWPTTTQLFLPVARSAAVLPYYQSLPRDFMSNDVVTVPAADFGVAGALFDEYLLLGTILMGFSFIVIVVCLFIYTGSLCVTAGAISAIIMALLFAHFIYTFVFGIKFFPFINLLAVVIAIGIGADDAFIYVAAWRRSEDHAGGEGVAEALRGAAPSMCVTSLTTAAALFANCVSPITAINCFSVFAGTAVLCNLVLMLTWLPACVLIADSRPGCVQSASEVLLKFNQRMSQMVAAAEAWVQWSAVALRWLWLGLLGGIALVAAVIVMYYPKLRLPDNTRMPLFESSHPFEQYDEFYRNLFYFEHDQKQEEGGRLLVQFVWGVIPQDDGNHLDPASRGMLEFDPQFDITSQESQKWLLQFCQDIRAQPWYAPSDGPQLGACFIETFKRWMGRRCKAIGGQSHAPCCETSPFPFSHRVFTRCVAKAIAHLHATPHTLYRRGVAGPKFAKGKSEIKAMVIEFESNYTFSTSMPAMGEFYSSVESWFQTKMATAPLGMRGGWFVSDLSFWDLQVALNEGTQSAIFVSLLVALVVVFLTTLNTYLSIFTVFTIAAIIFVTVAILVLLGWRLNVLESVAVTTAIGLAVDLPLHYAVHYGQGATTTNDRHQAVSYAVTKMAGPTAMAALTTAVAGAFMLFSPALAYIQVGILLLILTFISWTFATLLLMPLLAVAGPIGKCGQWSRPHPKKWCRGPPEDKPMTMMAPLSELTVSTSSGPADIHELQALKTAAQSPEM